MKKSLFIFFTLIIFTNVSYASFPVSVEFINQNAEKSIDYHKNISKVFLVTGAVGLIAMLY